jgi:hypothetical protein
MSTCPDRPYSELGTPLDGAIHAIHTTQSAVAEAIHYNATELNRCLNGTRLPPGDVLERLVAYLNQELAKQGDRALLDIRELLLLRERLKAEHDGHRQVAQVWTVALEEYRAAHPGRPVRGRGPLTLEAFPSGFDVQTLLTGDRREDPPQTIADVLALPASTAGDLFYLPELRFSPRPWTDKLVKLVGPERLRRTLNHDILVVGSPATNLSARVINRAAPFRFNVAPDALAQERRIEDELGDGRCKPGQLADYFDPDTALGKEHREALQHMQLGFAWRDFLDPIGPSHRKDQHFRYGVVTLCRHPWSEQHVAVFLAGDRGDATAAALKLLTSKDAFRAHPLGGVFRVLPPQDGPWEERYLSLDPKWHTRPYDLNDYLAALARQRGEDGYPEEYVTAVAKFHDVLVQRGRDS